MIKGFQGSELVADISVSRPKGCVSLDMKAREKPGLGLGLLRFLVLITTKVYLICYALDV